MLNKNRTRRFNTDAWDHLYTKFERYLDIWSLNYHYHKIIILAQFKYWCKHPLRITRPSQNDKNMPRVSGRATVQLVRHLGIILNPGSHGPKDFLTQSSVRSPGSKMEGVFLYPFFLLSVFYNGDIADNNCPHGKEKVWRQEGRKKDRLIAD